MPAWDRTVLAGPSQPATKPNGASVTPPRDRRIARTPCGAIVHAGQLGAVFHLDPPVGEGLGEHFLDVHLPYQRQVRERRIRQREVGQPDADNPVAQVQVRGGRDVRPGQQCLRHPQRAQHFQGAGMHDQRTRGPVRLVAPLDDPHVGAVIVGLQGKRQPGRAGSGHQNARAAASRDVYGAPPRRPACCRPGQDLRPGEQVVPAQPWQHHVVNRSWHRYQREHPPQGAGVVVGPLRPVPLIQTAVAAALVVGQPQLRDKARESRRTAGC